MPEKKKNRKKWIVAILLLLLIVLASTYFSAYRGMKEEISAAKEAFMTGTDGSGYSIYTDLQARVKYARNLHTLALRYLDAEDIRVRDLDAAANRLDGETSPHKAYEADAALTEAAEKVSLALESAPLSGTDRSARLGIMQDLETYAESISRRDYNDLAREINEKFSRFPASFFRIITFTEEAEYFQ